ncbi:MAG: metallophosphoesterase [Moraxellaceae bacterium]|nr:metallophosphoesterase [Moraxellaceae bacterium]
MGLKLMILSDLHLDSCNFTMREDIDFDVVVVAGDLCDSGPHGVAWLAQSSFNRGKPVIYVPGNHEFYSYPMPHTLSGMRQQATNTPIHLLDRGTVIIDGVRFVGCTLWTDWQLAISGKLDPAKAMATAMTQMLDYRYICPTYNDFVTLKPKDTLTFHERDREWLLAELSKPFDGKTVVITHHAPHQNSLAKQYADSWISPAFVSNLPEAAFSHADLWIHGHTHTSFDYEVNGCRMVCNPRGYMNERTGRTEVETFDDAKIVFV